MEVGISQVVYHPKYGRGIVTDITSATVVVLFDDEISRAFNKLAAERELSLEPTQKEENDKESVEADVGRKKARRKTNE